MEIPEMRARNAALRAAVGKALRRASGPIRAQINAIAAKPRRFPTEPRQDLAETFENLRRRALALIVGGSDPEDFPL
jgi:hypothetical protein